MRDGPFAWLSHAAIIRARSAAGAHGLAVMVALAARAPVDGSDFKASINNLATGSGLSVRTVHRILPVLVQARVIAMDSGRGGGINGGDTANTFRILRVNLSFAEGGGCSTDTHPSAQQTRGRVQSQSTSLAEDRDISAERQREISPPTAPAPAIAGPDLGEGEEWISKEDLQ